MNLNGIRLTNVDIKLIEPIYIENTSESALRRRFKILNNGEQLFNYPIVEKDNVEDKYWLISGYIDYLAYKEYANYKHQDISIPVIEQPYSSKTFQRIKLLRKMFQDHGKWLDKHILLNNLLSEDLTLKEIAKKTGLSYADLNNYLIHHELPQEIIDKAYKNNGSFNTLEQIRRSQIHPLLKHKLYLTAVLPIRDSNRLTIDKFQKITWLLGLKEFRMLKSWRDQWIVILRVMNYKEELLTFWRKECIKELGAKVSGTSSII